MKSLIAVKSMLHDVISTAAGFADDANVIVFLTWESIVERRVLEVFFPSLNSYKQHVSFNTLILPFLLRHQEQRRGIARDTTQILAVWNFDIFAPSDPRRPLRLTCHLFRALKELANISVDIPLLQRLLSTEIHRGTVRSQLLLHLPRLRHASQR
jgi:hypothetical protein